METSEKRQVTNTLDGFIKEAFSYIDNGNINTADEIFSALLDKYPGHPGCLLGKALVNYHNKDFVESKRILYQLSQKSTGINLTDEYLALIAFEENHFEEAKYFVKKCLDAVPTNAFFQRNMGFVFLKQHKYREAITYFENAISLSKEYAEAYFLLGYAEEKIENFEAAFKNYQAALKINPKYTDAILGLSHYFILIKDYQQVIKLFKSALESSTEYQDYQKDFNPDLPKNILDYANQFIILSDCYLSKKKYILATVLLETYILLNPDQGYGYLKLGLAYKAMKDFDNAKYQFMMLTKLEKNNLEGFFQLAQISLNKHDYLDAIPNFEKILQSHLHDKEAFLGLGTSLIKTGQYQNGLDYLERALNIQTEITDPNSTEWIIYDDLMFNMANLKLLYGEFSDGFKLYQYRLPIASRKFPQMSRIDQMNYPELIANTNLNGASIYLINEQGFGDAIQFLRFCKRLKSLGPELIYLGPNQMHRLVSQVNEISSIKNQISLPNKNEYLFHLASFGYLFKLQEKDLSDNFNYLTIDKAQSELVDTYVYSEKDIKIGLCYQGSKTHSNDSMRSVPLNFFDELLNIEEIDFFSLVINIFDESEEATLRYKNLKDLKSHITDLYDTAAIIDKMDLIITVDTVVAHLAGTLNKPCWVLIPYVPDWRWQLNREDSPWYPSLRLIRQTERETWPQVIKRIRKLLKSEYGL
jgi:tetratricopeptide (TPR) repeat protein